MERDIIIITSEVYSDMLNWDKERTLSCIDIFSKQGGTVIIDDHDTIPNDYISQNQGLLTGFNSIFIVNDFQTNPYKLYNVTVFCDITSMSMDDFFIFDYYIFIQNLIQNGNARGKEITQKQRFKTMVKNMYALESITITLLTNKL